jgi:hypothetical protein
MNTKPKMQKHEKEIGTGFLGACFILTPLGGQAVRILSP